MSGSIRIIGGRWRGRKLPVLDKVGLRPTTDRIKETLFNWLMPIIQDATVLDCFSGSGSLGFEAASRGAQHVTLLERERATFNQLMKNRELCQTDKITIYHVDTLSWLNQPAIKQYNLLFIDPPFHHDLVEKTVMLLEQNHWLANRSYIYIEAEIEHDLLSYIPKSWQLHREKIAGQVHSYLFIRESE